MAKNLVIVESPSKAKTIEKMLGDNYEVVASVGHVIDLPKNKINIDIENGFTPNYQVIKGKEEVLEKLKKKSEKANAVFLASDPDREGEAIAWHISNYINQGQKVKRIEFNEITKNAIKTAVKNPRDINMNLVHSQQARRLLDRLVGYLISPLLWTIVGKKSSAGRVQSVALKLICELEAEILRFIPQTYYELEILIKKNIKLKLAQIENDKIDKILDKKILEAALKILEENTVKIVKLEEKNKTQKPPVVLKTSTLQQLSSSYLGYNASKTMSIAQKLYEGLDIAGETKGLITYMRTDSIRVSSEAISQAKKFITEKYGKEYVGTYVSSKSKNSQDAHEGIRPTDINLEPDLIKKYLTGEQYKLYKLIWERFLVSQFANVKYIQLSIEAIRDKYLFKGSLNKVTFDGYYKIFKSEDMIKTEDFPNLELNKEYKIDEILTKEAQTKAPTRFTEATLIKKLESLGIGRPSTYASIIDSIKKREYVKIEDKKIVPTSYGKEIKQYLDKNFKNIMNVKFTANMEEKLDKIAQSGLEWQSLLAEFYNSLKEEIEEFKVAIKIAKESTIYTDVNCSSCVGKMLLKSGRYGKYLVCDRDPSDKINLTGLEIDEDDIKGNSINIKQKLDIFLENKKGLKTDVFTQDNKMYLLKKGRYGDYLESTDYENDNLRKSLSKEIRDKIAKNKIEIENGILKLNDLLTEQEKLEKEIIKSAGKCEKCNSDFVIKTGRYGKFLACLAYPKCKNIKKMPKIEKEKKTKKK